MLCSAHFDTWLFTVKSYRKNIWARLFFYLFLVVSILVHYHCFLIWMQSSPAKSSWCWFLEPEWEYLSDCSFFSFHWLCKVTNTQVKMSSCLHSNVCACYHRQVWTLCDSWIEISLRPTSRDGLTRLLARWNQASMPGTLTGGTAKHLQVEKKSTSTTLLHLRWVTVWGIHSLSRVTLIIQLCGKQHISSDQCFCGCRV